MLSCVHQHLNACPHARSSPYRNLSPWPVSLCSGDLGIRDEGTSPYACHGVNTVTWNSHLPWCQVACQRDMPSLQATASIVSGSVIPWYTSTDAPRNTPCVYLWLRLPPLLCSCSWHGHWSLPPLLLPLSSFVALSSPSQRCTSPGSPSTKQWGGSRLWKMPSWMACLLAYQRLPTK
jgi:hypothetical protein